MLAGAAGGRRGDLPGAAGRRPVRRRGPLLLHGLRVGGPAALPGQLDRRLFDVRPVHHPQADLQPARSDLPGTARPAAVRGPDARSARRSAGSMSASSTGCGTGSSSPMPIPRQLKPAVGGLLLGLVALAFPQVMTGGYGWVQWGAIGMPPELTLAGRVELRPPHGDGAAPDRSAVLKIVATGLTISSGGSGGVFGPSMLIGGMIGGAYGQLMASMLPERPHQPGRLRARRHGGLLRRGLQDAADLDRDGQRDDRLVQPARPLDAGLRAEHGDLAAVDDLRGAGAQPDRQPGPPGRLRGRRARPDPGRRGRDPHRGHRADPRRDAVQAS